MKRVLAPALIAFCGITISSSWASAEVLTGNFTKRAGPNYYHVEFPPALGGQVVEMPITGGQFKMEVDRTSNVTRLLDWRQEIAPISIAGASTGQIVVTLDGSQPSSGTYSPDTNTFQVAATFVLSFDDSQLRQFGLTSPFVMPAAEIGTVYGYGHIGQIYMSLSGTGQFGLGEFAYSCRTSAEFQYDLSPDLVQPGDVNQDHLYDVSDPIAAVGILFLNDHRGCPGAIEVNGDGERDVSDVIYLFDFLFQGGSAPPFTATSCSGG